MSCQGERFDGPRGYGDDTVRLVQLVRGGESVIDRPLLRALILRVHRSDAERLASKPRILNVPRKLQRLTRRCLCDSGDTIPLLCTDVHVFDAVVALSGLTAGFSRVGTGCFAPTAVGCKQC